MDLLDVKTEWETISVPVKLKAPSQKEIITDIVTKMRPIFWNMPLPEIVVYSDQDTDLFGLFYHRNPSHAYSPAELDDGKEIRFDCLETLNDARNPYIAIHRIHVSSIHPVDKTLGVVLHEFGHLHTQYRLRNHRQYLRLYNAHFAFHTCVATREQVEIVLKDERLASRKAVKWAKGMTDEGTWLKVKHGLNRAYDSYRASALQIYGYRAGPLYV